MALDGGAKLGDDLGSVRIAQVLLPLPLPEAFDYAEPEGMALVLGEVVAAPLGPRLVRGVVTGLRDGAGANRALTSRAARCTTWWSRFRRSPPLSASK